MSGFLDRMVARAAGAAAEVAPRVPALFESAGVTAEPIGATAAEGEPVPLRLPSASRQDPPAVAPRGPTTDVGRPAVAATESIESRPPVSPALPVDSDRELAGVRVERELVSVPAVADEPPPTPAPRPSQPAAPVVLVVPAVPVALAVAAPPSGLPESAVAAQRGPDVIRVSIGRVDVRAPAAPPRPAAPPVSASAAKADRLSLQDYLRGQRGTR